MGRHHIFGQGQGRIELMDSLKVATTGQDMESVDAAIESRYSCRAFVRDRRVARCDIEDILRVASRSASGTNTQPWKVYVLQDDRRDALVARVCAAHDAVRVDPARAVDYGDESGFYPKEWVSPYIDRRRQTGWGFVQPSRYRQGREGQNARSGPE